MTPEEAKAVGQICMNADGGCQYCARDLLEMLVREFPSHADVFRAVWSEQYDSAL